MSTWEVRHGDCRDVMRSLPPESVDAIVSDPPYGLSFMGKEWDHGVPGVEFWTEALRVAKPGAHLVAFGGTRTYHRLAVAIEDAGWEVRDCLSWLYGSGFPKSLAVDKAIDKVRDDYDDIASVVRFLENARQSAQVSRKAVEEAFGTINIGQAFFTLTPGSKPRVPMWDQWLKLKGLLRFGHEMDAEVWRLNGRKGQPGEAWAEREVVGQVTHARSGGNDFAKRPGSVAIARVADITAPATDAAKRWHGWGTALKPAWEPIILARKPLTGTVAANVTQYGTGAINVDGCRIPIDPIADASQLRTMTRNQRTVADGWGLSTVTGDTPQVVREEGRWPANVCLDEDAAAVLDAQSGERKGAVSNGRKGRPQVSAYGDRGAQPQVLGYGDSGGASRFFYTAKVSRREREAGLDGMPNAHPTVKPIALMRWLCRLVTPPGGLILDPFNGSGSTGCAAVLEGFRYLGAELEAEYVEIARRRIAYWESQRAEPDLFG